MERKYDLTKGDVFQTILMFMLPILAGNVFQQLYSAVDTIIVGRTLGSEDVYKRQRMHRMLQTVWSI